MDPDEIAEQAGAVTEAAVEAALESAEAREEAAAEVVEQVVESARQAEIVRTVEERIAEIERWHGAELGRLMERLSSAETQLGLMTERLDSLTASLLTPPAPPEPEPTPEPSIPPEPPTLPESAEDGQKESREAPEPAPHKRSRPSRRFW